MGNYLPPLTDKSVELQYLYDPEEDFEEESEESDKSETI
jgi:hypothetical protein